MGDMRILDMGKYGVAGTIELCKPSLRKLNMRKNELGRCTKTEYVNGKPIVVDIRVGDASIINTLSYVRKAPFPTDLEGFLDYCDRMDEANLGSAEAMLNDMDAVIEEIKGEGSPLENSQGAETQNLV